MTCKNVEKYLVLFYNRIAETQAETIKDIPPDLLLFLSAYDYEEIIKPFVIEDLYSGLSREQIAVKYGVKTHHGRRIGRDLGIYKKKSRSLRTG